jgi:hypothetical protein
MSGAAAAAGTHAYTQRLLPTTTLVARTTGW